MAKVLCGLDNIKEYSHLFEGKRIGLLTVPAAITVDFEDSISVFHKNYNLTALFSPEHGVRGDRQAGVPIGTYVDEHTGVTVYSIYGTETHEMTEEHASHFDVLVYDVLDVGSRFYTYLANLVDSLKLCARLNKPLVVLDRPNMIGDKVEGNVPEEEFLSLVCAHRMPQRYGLTPGEFATMINGELNLGCDLHIVPMTGYKRNMKWEDTDLPYVNASPNLPSLDGIFLYNGTCYFEGTTLSEGRGTTKPFEIIGAPWIDPFKFADVLNAYQMVGVKFRPTYFSPTFNKHAGEICGGVQVHVTNRDALNAVEVGLRMYYEARKLSEGHEFINNKAIIKRGALENLSACTDFIKEDLDVDKLLGEWAAQAAEFKAKTEKYHIYC